MRREARSLVIAGWMLGLVFLTLGTTGNVARAQTPPTYKVDPFWPQDLPNNWTIGQIGGISIDEQDHVWVLQRPRSLTPAEAAAAGDMPTSPICCKPAPSVLEFDKSGNLLRAWGGPEGKVTLGQVDAYSRQDRASLDQSKSGYDWPSVEHGILVRGGFVYLGGNGETDGMILKFTTDGKFVAQWGGVGPQTSSNDTSRFWKVADMELDVQANELYVADGYGNKRVAVIDATTGVVKRYWGAYGQKPVDDANAPKFDPKSKNFSSPVHCVALAKSGLVYVCDRSNNRVQVFKKDGTFVKEFAFEPATRGSGSTWDLTFSPRDREQKFVIMADGTNNQVVVWRAEDGQVVKRFGRAGHNAGQFSWLHHLEIDSSGDLYTGEVDVGKRMQKWKLAR